MSERECRVTCDLAGCRKVCDPQRKRTRWIGGGLIIGGAIIATGALVAVAFLEVIVGIALLVLGGMILSPLFYAILGIVFSVLTALGGIEATRHRRWGAIVALIFSGLNVALMVTFIFTADAGFVGIIPPYITALVGSGIAAVGSVILALTQKGMR